MANPRNPEPRHRHSDIDTGTDVHWRKTVNIFKFFSLFAGLAYGIKACVEATSKTLASTPGVNLELADDLPLSFYQSLPILIITTGTLSQACVNLGLSLDILTQELKSYPWSGSKQEIKDWWQAFNAKNAAHVVGTLFGIIAAITFICYPNTKFTLPFGAEKNVPQWILKSGAVGLIGGSCSNLFAYSVDGLREILYGLMGLSNVLGPKLVWLMPLPSFNLDNYGSDAELNCANALKVIGAIIGTAMAINGSSRLTKKGVEFPFVSKPSAQKWSLSFYNFISLPFIGGTMTNYFFHFGVAIDKLIEMIRLCPGKSGSWGDYKDWFFKYDIKDASHLLGLLFGMGLAFTYIDKDTGDNQDSFTYPYDAQTGVPAAIMQILAIIYFGGLYANVFSFSGDAIRQGVAGVRTAVNTFRSKVGSVLPFSIFGSSTTAAPPVIYPGPPTPWLPYIRPAR